MIVEAAARAKAVEVADQPFAWTVAGADDALELIDRGLYQIARLDDLRGAQARLDGRRDFVDSRLSGPRRAQGVDQRRDTEPHPLVVGDRGRLDQQREPPGAADHGRVDVCKRERPRQRHPERVAELRGQRIEVASQQKGRQSRVEGLLARDRVRGARATSSNSARRDPASPQL